MSLLFDIRSVAYSKPSFTSGAGTAHPSGVPEFTPPTVFNGVRVTRSLVLCVCFVDRCLSFYAFSFDHCVVCSSSSIYGFWLPLWYLQILLTSHDKNEFVCIWFVMHIIISYFERIVYGGGETISYLYSPGFNEVIYACETH
jgi:hypothetical protein